MTVERDARGRFRTLSRLAFVIVVALSAGGSGRAAGAQKSPDSTRIDDAIGNPTASRKSGKAGKGPEDKLVAPEFQFDSLSKLSAAKKKRIEELMSQFYGADIKLPRDVTVQGKVGDTATGAVFEANGSAAVVKDPCARELTGTPAMFQQPYTKRKLEDRTCPDGRTVAVWELVQG